MEVENTQQGTKSQREVGIHLLMALEIGETEVYHLNHSGHQGPQTIEISREADHTIDKTPMIGQVTIDHMIEGGEEVRVIGDMIDHFAQEVMTEEAEEDMHLGEIEVVMIEEEGDMIEVTHVAMIEVVEGDTIEEVIEAIQEDTLVGETEDIQDHMLLEEIVDIQEGMTEVIVAAVTIPEVADIEAEEGMTADHETILHQEVAVTIDRENILDQGGIQVTGQDMMTEGPHQVATREEATQEVVVTGQEMMIVVDILHDEIILRQIVMIVEAHLLALLHILRQVDTVAAHLLKDLTDIARVVSTEVITEAVVEAEIIALPIQVIVKKVAMIEVMILAQEGIFQEMIIILAVVLQEAVHHQLLIQDMQVKNVKK